HTISTRDWSSDVCSSDLHLTEKFSVTGGVRYGRYGGSVDTFPGTNTAYFTNSLFFIPGPLAVIPVPASTTKYPSAEKASWKASRSEESRVGEESRAAWAR